MSVVEHTVLFPFCGLGAGARGFLDAAVELRGNRLVFRSLGGIDNDSAACEDFEYLTKSPALCADMATLTTAELREFAGGKAPDVVFMSAPCKGFSSLLSKTSAKKPKYQAMNRLALDWIELMLSTWDVPPKLVLFENVPRIASRGRALLEKIRKLLRAAGYVFHSQTHDCGELGGLAQHRMRFLLVARHPDQCAPLLYQPSPRRVRACGEVLGELPLPEDPSGGAMHKLPKLSWLNWVRLALIPAGGDWRDLEGVLSEGQPRRELFRRHHVGKWDEPIATVAGSGSNGPSAIADPRAGRNGVLDWGEPSKTIAGESLPSNGPFSVADPRTRANVDRVTPWSEPVGTITSSPAPSSGAGAVADPRVRLQACGPNAHHNLYRVEAWDKPTHTVIGATRVGSGALSVADPRTPLIPEKDCYDHAYGVLDWKREPSPTIAGGTAVGQGAYAVADVRFGSTYYAGTYGVLSWQEAAGTITGNAKLCSGRFSVADPRKPPPELPMILSEDGTWHRPLTTLELAALQGMPTVVDGKPLTLAGGATGKWRERIGNAVPTPTAQAIAEQMLVCLGQGRDGSWSLSGGNAVWVERRLCQ